MKTSLGLRFIFAALVLAAPISAHAQLQIPLAYNWRPPLPVRELFINNPVIQYAAVTQWDANGAYISFNIPRLNQPPEGLLFLRVHEYGHVVLRHTPDRWSPQMAPQLEAQADCWAGQQLAKSDREILNRILQMFDRMGNSGGDWSHGTGTQMALVVRRCIADMPEQQASGNLDGDWGGNLQTPQGNLPLVLHIKSGGGSTLDSPSQNAFGIPTNVTVSGNSVRFTVPSVNASFEGTAQGSQISGTFSQNGSNLSLTLTKQGASGGAGGGGQQTSGSLDGDWTGTLQTPQGGIPLVFHIRTAGGSTTDSPNQNAFGIPINVAVNGNDVRITIPSINGSFQGTLQGTQISGTYSQNGSNLPLTLSKQSTSGGGGGQSASGSLDGDWDGNLQTPQGNLPLVLHIRSGGGSTLDSPSQNAFGIPTNVTVSGSSVRFTVPSVNASFEGTAQGSQISGTFSQNGANLPLTLTKR